jgi:hypothetical protein
MTYFEFKTNYMGLEFKRNGQPIPSVVAWMLHEKGEWNKPVGNVTWRDKPGWIAGELKRPKEYDRYLDRVWFGR